MKFYMCLFSVILLFGNTSCGDEGDLKKGSVANCTSGTIVKRVADTEGVIHYNTFEKVFTIVVSIPNTYDSQDVGIPCNLSENFKTDGKKVVFSGEYRDYGKTAPIGGQVYYYLNIVKIVFK